MVVSEGICTAVVMFDEVVLEEIGSEIEPCRVFDASSADMRTWRTPAGDELRAEAVPQNVGFRRKGLAPSRP